MRVSRNTGWGLALGSAVVGALAVGSSTSFVLRAAPVEVPGEVTYTKDIAPILQRSCENCHRPDGAGPMSLTTYEEVRPWARAIKTRTGVGPHAGVMPPWYVEKNIGIQKFKDDPSLSALELAKVAKWADSGAARGNPADMPPARVWADDTAWRIGTPDLIVKGKNVMVKGNAPDWWGEVESVPIPMDEDRYVLAVEVKEVNDVDPKNKERQTVGGRYVFHHLIYRTQVGLEAPTDQDLLGGSENVVNWPVHEVGRNPTTSTRRAPCC